MDGAINLIALSIPLFFLLIGLELIIGKLQKTQLYRFNDAITNLSCGIGQQVLSVFFKVVIILVYNHIYLNYSLFTINNGSVLVWIGLFLGIDFCYYWFHRLAHEISFMWGSHVVHHQSEEYNLSVALRQGWFQPLFSNLFYLPLAFLGFSTTLFVVINSLQTLYQFWIHTKTINKLPPPIEYIFNTPSHHRVHHGVNPKYIDRNHGGTLIIFDRMFGTFQAEEEEVVYGVTQQPNSWNPLWLNVEYWVSLYQNVQRADNWKTKMQILLKEPGWTPWQEHPTFSATAFKKYDTTVPNGLNYYILFQYVLVLLGATLFLFSAEKMPFLANLITGLIIIWSLVNLGGLFESKRWAMYAEYLRLLVVAALVTTLLGPTVYASWVLIGCMIGVLFFSVWLSGYRLSN